MGSVEHYLVVGGLKSANTVLICHDIAEITMMSHRLTRTSVGNTFRIPMRARCSAALAEVAKLVDMEAVRARFKSGHFSGDLDILALFLDELGPAIDS